MRPLDQRQRDAQKNGCTVRAKADSVGNLNQPFAPNGFTADPTIVRLRLEIAPPVRVYPARKHMIVYTIAENGGTVFVLRVRHHRENWKEHPIENMP